jgi:hypothetical protein
MLVILDAYSLPTAIIAVGLILTAIYEAFTW